MNTSLEDTPKGQLHYPPTERITKTCLFKARSEFRSSKRIKRLPCHSSGKLPKRLEVTAKLDKAPASQESIKCALELASQDPDLIGDFSRKYTLPAAISDHCDLKTITPSTLASLVLGFFKDSVGSYEIIDCRYPYEYEGGHVTGALNMYTRTQVQEALLKDVTLLGSKEKHILVFHCEFSAQRGPNM